MITDTLIIGIHGFNSDGRYIEQLSPEFTRSGFRYDSFIYGKAAWTPLGNLIANRFRTSRVFSDLAQYVIHCKYPKVILVGHSHGLRLAWGVQNVSGYKVIGVIGINGALDRNTPFHKCWVINCYHTGDWILKNLARFRPFSKWGDYGARENESADINMDLSKYYDNFNPHSEFFNQLDHVMPVVTQHCKNLMIAHGQL